MAPRGTICTALAAAAYLSSRCLRPTSGRAAFVQPVSPEVVFGSASVQAGVAGLAAPAAPAAGSGEATARPTGSASVLAAAGIVAVASLVAGGQHRHRSLRGGATLVALGAKKGKGGKGGKGGKRGGAQDDGGAEDGAEEQPEIDTEALIMEYEEKMLKSIEVCRENFVTIRAGQATVGLLDGVKVSAYDSQVGINEVGTITVQDTRTLSINIFDESVIDSVDSSLRNANLGFSIAVNGSAIKITIPELTKDKRTQYAKLAKDFAEKSRSAVRNVRQTALKKIKGLKKQMSEDIVKSLEKEVEDLTKKHVGSIDKMLKDKETELLNL